MTPPSRARGLLVAVEGIDGAGKTTLVRSLANRLRRRGFRVALHREPNDPVMGRLAQAVGSTDPWTSAVYFVLDRYLARGRLLRLLGLADIVLTDRSHWSTVAYQGSAMAPRERRRLIELGETSTVLPDRVLLLDLPPAEADRRLDARGRRRAPLERRDTLLRVGRSYRTLARQHRWIQLDARRPARIVAAEAEARLAPTLVRRPPRRRR